jgi:hypothetical protein
LCFLNMHVTYHKIHSHLFSGVHDYNVIGGLRVGGCVKVLMCTSLSVCHGYVCAMLGSRWACFGASDDVKACCGLRICLLGQLHKSIQSPNFQPSPHQLHCAVRTGRRCDTARRGASADHQSLCTAQLLTTGCWNSCSHTPLMLKDATCR